MARTQKVIQNPFLAQKTKEAQSEIRPSSSYMQNMSTINLISAISRMPKLLRTYQCRAKDHSVLTFQDV